MNNRILCSTGAYIGPENGYDYRKIPFYAKELKCDALELMMLHIWYPYLDDVKRFLSASDCTFDVIHSDKQIGVLLSNGGDDDFNEAIRLFEVSCQVGECVGAKKLVLHLWGGYPNSDRDIEHNISALGKIYEISARYSLTTLIENIPCIYHEPFAHWDRIAEKFPDAHFIFDTRFGIFHGELDDTFDRGYFDDRVRHMHISDYAGKQDEFKRLRPILMPREGAIGAHFDEFFSRLAPIYHDTITLESPALYEDGSVGVDRLNAALDYIRRSTMG